MPTCSKCTQPSVILVRYSGQSLCKDHFMEFVDKRVKKELRSQADMKMDATIAIALSGGKDSVLMLHMLNDILGEHRNVRLAAVSVDEGIGGYRPESLDIAKENCRALDIPHHMVSFKDTIDHTMDELAAKEWDVGPCTLCGVFRRMCLNRKAKELGATHLAVGLNLDDTAQSILMNFVRGDVEKLVRLGPHDRVQPGLVPRITPLRTIPETETYLYTMLKGIPIHDGECPYSPTALRGTYRDILNDLEDQSPGTRHSLLKSLEALKEPLRAVYPKADLSGCTSCSEPTPHELCKACQLLDRIKK